jgi:hypothetical protein
MLTNADGQITKEQAEYVTESKSPAEHRCGICEWRVRCHETGKLFCKFVEGEVASMGGCKLFSIDLVKAANDPITLATNPPKK